MLDPWIIEQIRKREEDERHRRDQRPTVEIPYRSPRSSDDHGEIEDRPSGGERGVVIIDL